MLEEYMMRKEQARIKRGASHGSLSCKKKSAPTTERKNSSKSSLEHRQHLTRKFDNVADIQEHGIESFLRSLMLAKMSMADAVALLFRLKGHDLAGGFVARKLDNYINRASIAKADGQDYDGRSLCFAQQLHVNYMEKCETVKERLEKQCPKKRHNCK